jgi:hypothetical protein
MTPLAAYWPLTGHYWLAWISTEANSPNDSHERAARILWDRRLWPLLRTNEKGSSGLLVIADASGVADIMR